MNDEQQLTVNPAADVKGKVGRRSDFDLMNVEAAVEELWRRGEPMSVGAVKRILGKGSEPKIEEVMEQLPGGNPIIKVDLTLPSSLSKAFSLAVEERIRATYQDCQRRVDDIRERLVKQQRATLDKEKESSEHQQQLAAKTKEYDQLSGRLMRADDMINQLQAESAAKDQRNQELQANLAVAEERLEATNNFAQSAEARCRLLEAANAEKDAKLARALEEIANLRGQIDGLLQGRSITSAAGLRTASDDLDRPFDDDIPF